MSSRPRSSLLVPPLLALLGCPQHVTNEQKPAGPSVGAADPRVAADTDDLYHANPEKPAATPTPPAAAVGLGSGVPDETNGVCRLFAPKLPNPECCPVDLGLDVAVVQRACGHPLYLGESIQASCGYFFSGEDTTKKPAWLRLSFALESTTQAAARSHDERIGTRVAKDPSFHSEPIPGIPDAYWSRHDRLHWAFVPGWSKARLVSWSDETCSDEGMIEVLRHLAGVPEIPADAPRRALVPGGAPPPTAAG